MMSRLTESALVEQPAINWFKEIGYSYIHGSSLDERERESYRHCVLKRRFINSIKRLNPWLTDELAEKVYKMVVELEHPDFTIKGKMFYNYLTEGVKLTFREGKVEKTKFVKLVDFENVENNEFLVANQFKVEYQYERGKHRIPDLVVFINGIPIAIFEVKGLNSYQTANDAFLDHKAKMNDIPQLYVYSQIIAVSDGYETKYGSPTSDWERFFVWEGIQSDDDVEVKEIEEGHYRYIHNGREITSLELLIKGLFKKEHLLEFINDFVFYEKDGETYKKKIAGYHQFYTVKKAVQKTIKCVLEGNTPEERRIGVVWHTQGSGKSLTMLFYARKVLKIKELENPLLIFITDRNNLDEQLYKLFSELPIAKQAESIEDLQETIKTSAGGILFTTIQKFGKRKARDYPLLTERKNIIVIADEAHRSQYRELAQNLRKAIPNASFLGFTATPIELKDRDTYLVFGESISVYPIDKALRHKVVVRIYYEPKLVELHLTNEFIDEEFEEISEGLEPELKESLKNKYAKLESLILSQERLEKIAKDIVEHFNKRTNGLEGKGMVVVISRKVAVELYKAIKKLPDAPSIEVIMSGNKQKDPEDFHPFIRTKEELEEILSNFKNPERDPKMVIVVDMLLTGFDVPCLHTMYIDKPMKNHNLMQAIARVNRVFKDKPAGLVVDYIGIADDLRKSLSKYTISAINQVLTDINKVLDILKEKYDIVSSMFYKLNYKNWKNLTEEKLAELTTSAYNLIKENGLEKKFIKNYLELKRVFALASPHPETLRIKDELRFFEMIKKMILRYSETQKKEIAKELDYEIKQLISKSILAEEPVDIFSLLKKEKPDISIFDEEFLSQIANLHQKGYATDVLMKLIKDELKGRIKINPFRYKTLYERLQKLIEMCNVKLISTADVINELIEIAKEVKVKLEEGKMLNLTEEELAFYDIVLKDGLFKYKRKVIYVAKQIKKELVNYVKLVDWNKKEEIKSGIRKSIKKLLFYQAPKKYKMDKKESEMLMKRIDKLTDEIFNHIINIYAE